MKKSAVLLVCASAAVAALASARKEQMDAACCKTAPPPDPRSGSPAAVPATSPVAPPAAARNRRRRQQFSSQELMDWFTAELERIDPPTAPLPMPARQAAEGAPPRNSPAPTAETCAMSQEPAAEGGAARTPPAIPTAGHSAPSADEAPDSEATDDSAEVDQPATQVAAPPAAEAADPPDTAAPAQDGFWSDNIFLDSGLGVTFTLPDRWEGLDEGTLDHLEQRVNRNPGRGGLETMLHRSETSSGGKFEPGTWIDRVYTNASLRLTFTPPEGWLICTKEEIEANYGASAGVCNEMSVQDPVEGSNLLMMVQDLSDIAGGAAMSAEAYARMMRRQLEDIEELTYHFEEGQTVRLAGRSWWTYTAAVCAAGDTPELAATHQVFLFHKLGNSMVVVHFFLMEGLPADTVLQAIAAC